VLTSLFNSFRIVLVWTPLVADLKSYPSDSAQVSRKSVMMMIESVAVAYDSGCAPDAGRSSSWYFQGHYFSVGWRMRGKRGSFSSQTRKTEGESYRAFQIRNGYRTCQMASAQSFRSVGCGTNFLPGPSEKKIYQLTIVHSKLIHG
jgi:hypothetical protein